MQTIAQSNDISRRPICVANSCRQNLERLMNVNVACRNGLFTYRYTKHPTNINKAKVETLNYAVMAEQILMKFGNEIMTWIKHGSNF